MKKFIALLLVCLMVVPFGIFASVGVSADVTTVHVSDNGNDANDGSTAAKAVKTLPKAYELLGTAGGTIVIDDVVTITGYKNNMPAHTGKVTIKGADASAKLATGATEARFFTGGPTEVTDLTIDTTANTLLFVYQFNDITITDTVTKAGAKAAYLVASQSASHTEGKTPKQAYDYTPKDHTVTINGGVWGEVALGPRQGLLYSVDDNTGASKDPSTIADYDVTANIGGNAQIDKLFFFTRSYTKELIAPNASCTVNLNGGKITTFAGVNDQTNKVVGYGNGVTVNIAKTFDLDASFEAVTGLGADRSKSGTVYALSGESLYTEAKASTVYGALVNGTLVIADEIYDAVMADLKVSKNTFAEVKKASALLPPPPAATVYLSDNGDDANDGATSATAVKTIAKAYELLGAEGGEIVVVGTYSHGGNFTAPAHTGKVTLKGADASSKIVFTSGTRYYLGGETEITDLHLTNTGSGSLYIICSFNNLKVSDTVTVTRTKDFIINLGVQQGDANYAPKPASLVIEGGDWAEVVGVHRNNFSAHDPAALDGADIAITIDKNASVNKLFAFGRNVSDAVEITPDMEIKLNLLGGKVKAFICGTTIKSQPQGPGKGMQVYIGKNFDITQSFTDGNQNDKHYVQDGTTGTYTFYGISPESAWDDDAWTAEKINKSGVIICAELYDALKDSTRIRKDAFAYVIKEGDPIPGGEGGEGGGGVVPPPSADVVYVSDAGADTNDGITPESPFKTITKAYKALGETGGTIVVVGTFTQKATFTEPAHTGKVTIKGADENAVYAIGASTRFILGGETEFTDIKIEQVGKATWYVVCRFNSLTMSETVTVKRTGTFIINLGVNHDSPAKVQSATLTINGGDWAEVVGAFRNGYSDPNYDPSVWDGVELTINVGKNAIINKMFTFSRSMSANVVKSDYIAQNGHMRVNLLGGKITHFLCQTDSKNFIQSYGNGMTVYIGKDFDLNASFTEGKQDYVHFVKDGTNGYIWYGISAEIAWGRSGLKAGHVNKSEVIIASEKFDEYKLNDAIRGKDFLYLYEEGTAPAPAPDTGDNTWVIVAVAAIAVMGCAVAVVAKKRSYR